MLKTDLKIALRRLGRHRVYTLINVAGLAAGLACCLLILLFVRDELRYDRFHAHADRIFRLVADVNAGERVLDLATTPAPWGPLLAEDDPAVQAYVRFATFAAPVLVRHAERAFYEERFFWADSSVFRVFDFPLARGNPATALTAPDAVVLTAAAARTYFGDADPVGRTLTVDEKRDYRVTGVLAPLPAAMHFRFDFLASFAALEAMFADQRGRFGWGYHFYYTYLLLRDPAAAPRIAEGLPAFIARHRSERLAERYVHAEMQPLPQIYLHSRRSNDVGPRGNPAYVRIFGAVAVFILLIACVNFMNLTTAQSAERAREVGMRKAFGAVRGQLVRQFLGESMVLAGLAAAGAVGLTAALLPLFNAVAAKTLTAADLAHPWLAGGLLATTLAAGLGAGLYPAFYLSRPQPAPVLRADASATASGAAFRKALVVFQFAVAAFLIGGTAVIYRQLGYAQIRPMGFAQEHVVVVPMHDLTLRERYRTVEEAFRRHPDVVRVAAASSVPGALMERYAYRPEGLDEAETMTLPMLAVDYDFVETLGLEVAAGRAFSEAFATDAEGAFMVNRRFVEEMGWQEPLGKALTWVQAPDRRVEGTIIGVVNDFHTASLREAVEPMVLHVVPERFNFFVVRLRPGDARAALDFLRGAWNEVAPGWPFEYRFLEDDVAALYGAERRLGTLSATFAALAVVIACLGLFGLAAFTAERRTREIGIRKALGATTVQIVLLLSKDFVKLVLVGVVVATPAAYFAMRRWLEDFAYRTNLSWGTFLMAGLLALLIAFLTVSYQAVRAALTNPAQTLRHA